MRVVVTGAAGFIGSQVSAWLLARGDSVWGLDNLDPSGARDWKEARLAALSTRPAFRFAQVDVRDEARLAATLAQARPQALVHLAAHVGVRPGAVTPVAYADVNVTGFVQVLEACRRAAVGHVVFASSSSVYGASTQLPFRETDAADRPLSVYGATKRADELLAHAFAVAHGLPVTGLRLFTVYGPWGRPDMAPLRFLRALFEGGTLELHEGGAMQRDFTFVDDVAEAVARVLKRPPAAGGPRLRLFNVARGEPVSLRHFLSVLEAAAQRQGQVRAVPAQPGEMRATWGDPSALAEATGFRPGISVEEGVARLVAWYRTYAGI